MPKQRSFKFRNYKDKRLNSNKDRKKKHRELRGVLTDEKIIQKISKLVVDAWDKRQDEFIHILLNNMNNIQIDDKFVVLSNKIISKMSKKDKIVYNNKLSKYNELLKSGESLLKNVPNHFNLQDDMYYMFKTKENSELFLIRVLKNNFKKYKSSTKNKTSQITKLRIIKIWINLKYMSCEHPYMDVIRNKIIDNTDMWKLQLSGLLPFFPEYTFGEKHTCADFQQKFLDEAKKGNNIICTSKTGTGKTIIAEAIAIYNMSNPNINVFFLTPNGLVASQVMGNVSKYCKNGYALLLDQSSKTMCENPQFVVGEPSLVLNFEKTHNIKPDIVIIDEIHTINMVDTPDTMSNSLAILSYLNRKSDFQIIGLSATLSMESVKLLSDKIKSNNTKDISHISYNKYFVTHDSTMVSYSDETDETDIFQVNPIAIIEEEKLFKKDTSFNLTSKQMYEILYHCYDDPNDILNKIFKKSSLPYTIMSIEDLDKLKKQIIKIMKDMSMTSCPEPEPEMYDSDEEEMDFKSLVSEISDDKLNFNSFIDIKDKDKLKKSLTDVIHEVKKPALIIDDSNEMCYEYLDLILEEMDFRHQTEYPNWTSDREKDHDRLKKLIEDKNAIEKIISETKEDITIIQSERLDAIEEELLTLNPDKESKPNSLSIKKISRDKRIDCLRDLKYNMLTDTESKISWNNKVLIALHYGIGIVTKDMPISYQILILKLLSNGYLGIVIGDFKALGQGVNSGVVSVIMPWTLSESDDVMVKLQKITQAKGRAGRRGQGRDKNKNEGHEVFIPSHGSDKNSLDQLYLNGLPTINPNLTIIPLTFYLEVFQGVTGRGKDEQIINQNIDNYNYPKHEHHDIILKLSGIKDNWEWIYKIGNVSLSMDKFNDESCLIFYELCDIINHDLSHKSVSSKEIIYLWKIVIWLFSPYGEEQDNDIITLKGHIDLPFEIPLGYDLVLFNIIKENRLPSGEEFKYRDILLHINNNIIKILSDVKFPNIKIIALCLNKNIGKLTSINTFLNKK